jgi:hypothetical protein
MSMDSIRDPLGLADKEALARQEARLPANPREKDQP